MFTYVVVGNSKCLFFNFWMPLYVTSGPHLFLLLQKNILKQKKCYVGGYIQYFNSSNNTGECTVEAIEKMLLNTAEKVIPKKGH